ncbi:MAG: hypothetical protein HYT87_13985 [Nitrospirae bacterium]|nr:hypothetical protein [Nitrospirota bacterium]
MSKPIRDTEIETWDGRRAQVRAVVDSGCYPTIVRQDRLPEGTQVIGGVTREMRTAAEGGKLRIVGVTFLVMKLEGRIIEDEALISPDLAQDLLIGAKTMQAWDIRILNNNGSTTVRIGRDTRDPEITEVD